MASKKRMLRVFFGRWTTPVGVALLVAIAAAAIFAPWFYPEDPWSMVAPPLLWPGQNAEFPLGSDALGRDLIAGVFHGARVSVSIGLIATVIACVVGVSIGALAGYYGGVVDDVLMRITEAFQTVPPFILTLVTVTLLQPTITVVVFAIALVSWPTIARLTRAEFLTLRERDFIMACRSIGMSDGRIMFVQILPNALSPLIVASSIMVASAILTESSLSFLGLSDPNVVSWGQMIGSARDMLRTDWYLTAVPGAAIFVTVLAFNLVGEALNDALNPNMQGS